ncbi:MAG: glycosyltransferase family 2 protein [Thermoproteota archaeon]|nr:glycosyltransferase family 2 protein [Thermoproteota archaeon]
MSSANKQISIIIPALNEEKGISKTIDSIPKSDLNELGYLLEILVVDGDSVDSTRAVAAQKGARVIVEKRKGYGRAYKTGFMSTPADIIVALDADCTYPAELIPQYIRLLQENELDFITVNRFSRIEKGSMSLLHKLGNKILTYAMRSLHGVNVHDSQSGMWIMTRDFIDAINLHSDNMSMSEEIKIIAFKFFRSLEVDGKYSVREGTAKLASFEHGWLNLKYLIEYKRLIGSAVHVRETVAEEKAYSLTKRNSHI